jgi:hypothetical protein
VSDLNRAKSQEIFVNAEPQTLTTRLGTASCYVPQMFTEAVAAVCLVWYCAVVIVCGVGLFQLSDLHPSVLPCR